MCWLVIFGYVADSPTERQLGPRGGQKPILNWEQVATTANY